MTTGEKVTLRKRIVREFPVSGIHRENPVDKAKRVLASHNNNLKDAIFYAAEKMKTHDKQGNTYSSKYWHSIWLELKKKSMGCSYRDHRFKHLKGKKNEH